jgi:anaerobic ribonucleoside-triphosphate reductase activating protein
MELNLNSWLPQVSSLGPGLRSVVWLQGCDKDCDGCISPEMRPRRAEILVDPKRQAKAMINLPQVEGVTVSGGEPLLQAGPLEEFLRFIKENSNLNTMVYSGFTIEEIRAVPARAECLRQIDLLIDGRYDRSLPQVLWRGSSNQRLFSPTGYFSQAQLTLWENTLQNNLEVHLVNNRVLIVGIPDVGFLDQFQQRLKQRGIFFDQGEGHE